MSKSALFPGLIVFLTLLLACQSTSQVQPRKLIDCHTAGSLPRGYYDLCFGFFSNGGFNTAVNVGVTNRLSIGVAYQLMGLIGQGDIRGQSFPGGFAKFRLVEESYSLPAIALGFDGQGSGLFYRRSPDGDFYPRFYYKSKGFFASVSKSYLFIGQTLGFHLEGNYSVVDNQAVSEEDNRCINATAGMDLALNDELSLMSEYNFALDDNNTRDPLKGYWNAGLRWSIVKNLVVELDCIDILENKKIIPSGSGREIDQKMSREVRIAYIDKF